MIEIFVINDHKILLDAIINFLDKQDGITCIGTATSAKEGITKFKTIQPSIVLIDTGLPDMSGIDCTKKLLSLYPTLKVIGLSDYLEENVSEGMFRKGAKGYVSIAHGMEELAIAITKVSNGQNYVSPPGKSAFSNGLSSNTNVRNAHNRISAQKIYK